MQPRSLQRWARQLKTELSALASAYGDPRVPWYARVVIACVVAYALSPLDLIPDPIPLLGQLDDLVLVPLGIALAIRLIPPAVLAEHRRRARTAIEAGTGAGWVAALVIIALWVASIALTGLVLWRSCA